MTRSDQLRQALKLFYTSPDDADKYQPEDYVQAYRTLAEAGQWALRVWEGDQQLVERLEDVAQNAYHEIADQGSGTVRALTDHIVRAVLAAITEEGKK